MLDDPIVAEVRRVRAAQAAQSDNDLERIYRAIKAEEHKSGRKFVAYRSHPAQSREETSLTLKEPRQRYGDETQE